MREQTLIIILDKKRNDTHLSLVRFYEKYTKVIKIWYRCETIGQSNQVDQLKLLQKITLMQICEFCEDMSK